MVCSLPERASLHSPRMAGVAAVLAFTVAAICLPARAADEFAVTAAQMQSLGVTVQRLGEPTAIRGQAYPARVVLPPSAEQVVSAPMAGLIDKLLVAENDSVKPGQALLRLISPELGELQLKLLESATKSALSEKTLKREQSLFAEGIIPERRVQEAAASVEADRARLRHSEKALTLAGLDSASIKRIMQGGALQDGLLITAKAAGSVLALSVKPGQRVAQTDPLLRLANLSQLWLDVQIPADRRDQLRLKGGVMTVLQREATATAMSVGSMVSDSQTVSLRAQVVKGAERLRVGEYVQVEVPFAVERSGDKASGTSERSWTVPVPSVVRQGDKAYVFVRSSKGFVAQEVTVINSVGQSVQVRGPLAATQEIASGSVIALKAAWLGKGEGK